MPEVIDTVVTILKAGWTKANTTNRVPLIDKIWKHRNFQSKDNSEAILLYEVGNTDNYPSLGLKWKDQEWLISMEIRTSNRLQLIRIDDEIVRILDATNTSVTGFSWLELRGRRDLIQDQTKPFFRAVRDVRILKQSIVI